MNMILSADIKMPAYMNPQAADLCSKLLIKTVSNQHWIDYRLAPVAQNKNRMLGTGMCGDQGAPVVLGVRLGQSSQ